MPRLKAPLRIAFLGSDPIALPLLDWLAGEGSAMAELVGVFTGPDRPSGRGQQVRPNAVKAWVLARRPGLPVHQPARLDEAARAALEGLGADLSLVVAYGHILGDPFIATPRLGTLNLHASLLPAYRGASPIQTAVASGDAVTGMSLMRIVRELDAGPVADIERVPIGPLDTAAEVEAALARASVPLVRRALPALAAGELAFAAQDAATATFCRRLSREDGAIDFGAPASVIAARIRGLNPWPSAAFGDGGIQIRVGLADTAGAQPGAGMGSATGAASGAGKEPGEVLGADGRGLCVATGEGVVRLLRLQRPGGRMLGAPEFLRGHPIAPGTRLASVPMPPLVARSPFPWRRP